MKTEETLTTKIWDDDCAMNEWWFRHVHVRTQRHLRNVEISFQVINWGGTDLIPAGNPTRFLYAKGIMKGCGCNVLA